MSNQQTFSLTVSGSQSVSLSTLHRVGCFRLSLNSQWRSGYQRVGNSPGRIHFSDNRLYCESHVNGLVVAEFTPPVEWVGSSPMGAPWADQSGPWVDLTQGQRFGDRLGGFALVGGKWAWMSHEYYNADSSHDPCFGVDGSAPVRIGPHSQRTAGFVAYADGYLYCGHSGGPIDVAKGHPALYRFPFDPASLPPVDLTAEEIVYYPDDPNAHESWDETAFTQGCVVLGDYAVMFGQVGVGVHWYGEANEGPNGETDPCGGGKGDHTSDGRDPYAWVVRISTGEIVEHGSIRNALGDSETVPCLGIVGAGYDPATGNVYLSTRDVYNSYQYDRPPLIFVMRF